MLEKVFRTCIFGGYNKDDVAEYIRKLQAELDELKEKAGKAGPEPDETEKTGLVTVVPDETEDYVLLQEENRRLREELESMKNNRIKSEEDYEAIKKVLLDARVDAGVITAKAHERADRMIAETEEYLKDRKRKVLSAFRKEMESRGIEILTSKYKINSQIENLEKAYQELQQVKQYMEEVVNSIPSGIEAIMMETELNHIEEFQTIKMIQEEPDSGKGDQEDCDQESREACGQTELSQENRVQERQDQENPCQERQDQENPGQERQDPENPGRERQNQENPCREQPDQEDPDQGQQKPSGQEPGDVQAKEQKEA